MTTITIVLTDLAKGRGVTVKTDGTRPAIGRPLTPAEALAMDLMRTCTSQANEVHYLPDLVQPAVVEHHPV